MVPYYSAIYSIRNILNGHMYIGSAEYCVKRLTRHKWELNRGTHHSQHLQRAYDKYGKEYFDFSVVEYVDDKDKLLQREQIWLDFFRPSYNVAKVAGSPTKGLKFSAETRSKMSAAGKGRKRPPMSEEWKARISLGKLGKKLSEQARLSMKSKKDALFANPEFRKKWTDARVAILRSPDNLAKVALAMRGNQNSKGFKYAHEVYASRRGPRKKESAS